MNLQQRLKRYFRTCAFSEWEIWDRPTRFFHWSVTGLLIAAMLTGWFDPAWQLDRHVVLGAMIAGLLLFRLVWGMTGGEYTRFGHYVHAPVKILADGKDLWQGRLKLPCLGLNPLNALISLMVLLNLVGLIVTGLLAYGGEEHLGPLASWVEFNTGELAQKLHEWLTVLILLLVACHVVIILRESRLTRVSLMRSMITGCKPMDIDQPDDTIRTANFSWAVIFGVVLLFAVDHLSKSMAQLPMDGWRPLQYPVAYQNICGHCHWTIHPSLLPEETWQILLSHLDHHFGQQVAISGKDAVAITSFLLVHAAEDWNTDAAHRFRKSTPDPSQYITNHPMWQKVHNNIDPTIFHTPPVSSRLNCPVCHHDALSGRFDKHSIHMPQIGG